MVYIKGKPHYPDFLKNAETILGAGVIKIILSGTPSLGETPPESTVDTQVRASNNPSGTLVPFLLTRWKLFADTMRGWK